MTKKFKFYVDFWFYIEGVIVLLGSSGFFLKWYFFGFASPKEIIKILLGLFGTFFWAFSIKSDVTLPWQGENWFSWFKKCIGDSSKYSTGASISLLYFCIGVALAMLSILL